MNSLRSAAFGLWLYGSMLVLALVFLPAFLGPRGWLMAAARTWARTAIWGLRVIGGVRVEVRGLDRRPAGPVLVAAKHMSMLDTLAPMLFLTDPAFVLKRELLRLPIFGWGVRRADMIPIDREAHASALRTLVSDARARLSAGREVVIFPEGTRAAPGDPPDYKPGVAGLYRDLGVECVPMATNSGRCWSARGLRITPGVVVFELLEPIPPGLKRGEFMRTLQDRIETATDALLTA